jgi:hypothetical protein
MTDKEKLIALLEEFGIGFEAGDGCVTLEEGMEKVSGFARFFTKFQFDENGKFIEVGAWE